MTSDGVGERIGAPPLHTGSEEDDVAYEMDNLADVKPRKKRKLIQNSDKKYLCPHGECGKAYSRAEHLYRHQLNRASEPGHSGCDLTWSLTLE